VLGDGLHYEAMSVNPVEADLIKQLEWTDEKICSVFHVPAYKVGVGPDPNYNNINALDQQYYAQCLQTLLESIEILLDEGLELPKPYGTEFDLDDLLRMDVASMVSSERDAIGAGIKAPNESRKRLNLPPVEGGDTPYLQMQNQSLAALARRDAAEAEALKNPPPPPPEPEPDDDEIDPDDDEVPVDELAVRLAAAIEATT
jgi:phage portal protein BeeE